jgi:FMN phosphatase YigB (HAD superfamily)
MLDYFSIIPSDTVFIGDSLSSDISGANNVGIHSIWYNRNEEINNTLIIPNQEIKDLSELKKIL